MRRATPAELEWARSYCDGDPDSYQVADLIVIVHEQAVERCAALLDDFKRYADAAHDAHAATWSDYMARRVRELKSCGAVQDAG